MSEFFFFDNLSFLMKLFSFLKSHGNIFLTPLLPNMKKKKYFRKRLLLQTNETGNIIKKFKKYTNH